MPLGKLKKPALFLLLTLSILLLRYKGYCQTDKTLYQQGLEAAREGKTDFAFMHFNKLLSYFVESEYLEQALFAVGEYYFSINNHKDAADCFNRLIIHYPQSKARPFAIAYLLKTAEEQNNKDQAEILRKELISLQQLFLLFRDFQEIKYLSPLYNNYKALGFIDKLQIYINEKLFIEIPL